MGWRFFTNFITILAILGLTVFSLATYTDKSVSAESNPDNYYLFSQVVNGTKKVLKFLEDPKSIFIKDKDSEAETSNGTANSGASSEYVVAYGDYAVEPAGGATAPAPVSNNHNTGATKSSNSGVVKGPNDKASENKFDFSKEVKEIQDSLGNLRDPNWRQTEIPAGVSNTLKKYTESSTDLMVNSGFFLEKSEAGSLVGWRLKNGKIYQFNLPKF